MTLLNGIKLALIISLISAISYADIISPPLTVQEEDGSPSVQPVYTVKVTNGSLTDNADTSVTLNLFGGDATFNNTTFTNITLSSVSEPQVIYAGTDGLLSGDAGLTYDATSNELTAGGFIGGDATFVDATFTGRVGIGTTAPLGVLDVYADGPRVFVKDVAGPFFRMSAGSSGGGLGINDTATAGLVLGTIDTSDPTASLTSFMLIDPINDYIRTNREIHPFRNIEMEGAGSSFGSIVFTGTSGGGGEGVLYEDSGANNRYSLFFPGSDIVALGNRASNGVVQIRANNATAGSGGEATVLTAGNGQGESVSITSGVATDIGLEINGATSQSADLTQWKNSSGTILAFVEPDGDVVIGSATSGVDHIKFDASNASGDPEIRMFNQGKIDAKITANFAGGFNFNTDVSVTGKITTTEDFQASGLASLGSGVPTTSNVDGGSLLLRAAGGDPQFINFTENGAAFRANLGVANSSGDLIYETSPTNVNAFASGTQRFKIKSNGNVGIGPGDPKFKLHVQGDMTADDATFARATFENATFTSTLFAQDATFNSILPRTDDTYDLGSDTKRWRDIYLGPGSIHIGTSTSDEATLSYNTTTNVLEITGDATFGYASFSNITVDSCTGCSAGASVAGSDTEIQFNDGGSTFGADSDFTFNKSANELGTIGLVATHATFTNATFNDATFKNIQIRNDGTFNNIEIISNNGEPGAVLRAYTGSATGDGTRAKLYLYSARGTHESPTASIGETTINSGADIVLAGRGQVGGDIFDGAIIRMEAGEIGTNNSTWSSTGHSSQIRFLTAAVNESEPSPRWSIASNGDFCAGACGGGNFKLTQTTLQNIGSTVIVGSDVGFIYQFSSDLNNGIIPSDGGVGAVHVGHRSAVHMHVDADNSGTTDSFVVKHDVGITSASTTGKVLFQVHENGGAQVGSTSLATPTSMFDITALDAARIGTIIKGASSQTANLMEWQNSSGTVLGSIGPNGNLGIGPGAPNFKLHVQGAMTATDATFRNATFTNATFDDATFNGSVKMGTQSATGRKLMVTQSGNGGAVLIENAGTGESLRVNDAASDTSPFLIDDGGNVAIGATTANAKLDVRGTTILNDDGNDFDFRVESNDLTHMFFMDAFKNSIGINSSAPRERLDISGNIIAGNATFSDATFSVITVTNCVGCSAGSGDITSVGNTTSGAAAFDTTTDATFGNVQISALGYVTPGHATFDTFRISNIDPTVTFNETSPANVSTIVNTSSRLEFNADVNSAGSNSAMIWRVDNSEKLRLDTSGNFGIGDSSPDAVLEIVDNGTDIFNISATAAGDGNYLTVDTSGRFGIGSQSPRERMDINGNIIALDGTFTDVTFTAVTSNFIIPTDTTFLQTQVTTITHTEPGTPDYAIQDLTSAMPFGFVDLDEGRSVLKVIRNLQERIQVLEDTLETIGILDPN